MSAVTDRAEAEAAEQELKNLRDDLAVLTDKFQKIAETRKTVAKIARAMARGLDNVLYEIDSHMGWEDD